MSIGYACLAICVPFVLQKDCILKNVNDENIYNLIKFNLNSLDKVIEYNKDNAIRLFRISSALIPFGSCPKNTLDWSNIFKIEFQEIGQKIKDYNIRVSTHPGQYTVLNSPDNDVVKRAIEDLNYHSLILDSLNADFSNKMILHIGGVYNDKKRSINTFITNFQYLNDNIKKRLVIENDDKFYNVNDVLNISSKINIPVIFDVLHNIDNPYDKSRDNYYWIDECNKTWKDIDGKQKIHYSEQNEKKRIGSHSDSINIETFMSFYNGLTDKNIDIMLEVKNKNISAIKCINSISKLNDKNALLEEWLRYKYLIHEYSLEDYVVLDDLIKYNKINMIDFYKYIEAIQKKVLNIQNIINTAKIIWETYFKDKKDGIEERKFFKNINLINKGLLPLASIKNQIKKLTLKYNISDLFYSYYFI